MATPELIYKVFRMSEWRERSDPFKGSPDDLRDGFIHFSTVDQLPGTLERFFSGENDVLIAEFRGEDFGADLKWEEAGDGQSFPHLYDDLELELMIRSWRIAKRGQKFVLPSDLGGEG